MSRPLHRALLCLAGSLTLFVAIPSRADVPAGYKGKPFDPAMVGGTAKIPATVKAGPYSIPGRIDFINYDLGGLNVGYFTTDHITNNGSESIKLALGYRTDTPTATLCLSNQVEKDDWYQTGMSSLDGTFFPSATSADYYIGAVRPGDWFNYTVVVQTAGTYQLSSTWASGNGPPGGEGGDGAMELQVYVNDVMKADWKATFPNYQTEATFHNWMPFPNFATIPLDAGLQVIKLQSVDPHLNLAYVQFSLLEADGGIDDGSGGGNANAAGGAGNGGSVAAGGASVAGGSTASGGVAGGSGGSAAGGETAAGGSLGASGGPSGTSGSAGNGNNSDSATSSGCAFVAPRRGVSVAFSSAFALLGVLLVRVRRRSRRSV
jgi:hypothetical protein